MSKGVVTIDISGPQGSGKSIAAKKIAEMFRLNGKVVRHFDLSNGSKLPEIMPTDCHYIIIERGNGS